MKITVVSSSVYPASTMSGIYGSEHQNALLAKALVAKGHDVTFIATPRSERIGRFRHMPETFAVYDYSAERSAYEWYREELLQQDYIIDWSATCRVAENFYFWERSYFGGVMLWNRNGAGFNEPRQPACFHYHGVALSETARSVALGAPYSLKPDMVHVIPCGVDTALYRPSGVQKDYFLFLARPVPEKGIFTFIDIAKRSPPEQFVMAFDMEAEDHRFHGQKAIEAARDVPNLTYVPLGRSLQKKIELMQQAKALVIPLPPDYIEAFGLVFIEALSCGTPVITAGHGATAEVVSSLTGIRCGTAEQYLNALKQVDAIDRRECRSAAEKRFSSGLRADRYLALYEELKA